MPDSYIIEVSSQAAGIVVRDVSGYRFFAAIEPFYRLEGQLFRHVADAQRAAMRLVNHSSELIHQIYQREKVDDVAQWRDAVRFAA